MASAGSRSPARSARLLSILQAHAELMAKDAPLADVLRQLVYGACLLVDSPPRFGAIRVIDPVSQVSRQDVSADGRIYRPAGIAHVPVLTGIIGRAIRLRAPQIVDHLDREFIAMDPSVRAEIAIPMVIGDTCWGALNLESDIPNHFKRSQIPWLQTIARQAALAIKHDDLREQERLARFDHAARRSGMEPEHLRQRLDAIVGEALNSLPGLGASVELLALDQQDEVLVTVAYKTENLQRSLNGRFARGSTFAWQAVERRAIIAHPEVSEKDTAYTSVNGSHAVLALPLADRQGVILGVLNIEAPTPHSLDSAYDALLHEPSPVPSKQPSLASVRQQAELALRAASESLRREVTSLESVMKEIGQRILGMVDPDDVDAIYQLVLRWMAHIVGGEHVSTALAFLSGDTLSIKPEHTFNYEEVQKGGWSWDISTGVTGRAVNERISQLVDDTNEDKDYFVSDPNARCELVTPLMYNGEVIGVIDIVSPLAGAISRRHQLAVEAMTAQVVQALKRAEAIRAGQLAKTWIDTFDKTNTSIQTMLSNDFVETLRQERDAALQALLQKAMTVTASEFGAIVGMVRLAERTGIAENDERVELAVILHEPPDFQPGIPRHWPGDKGITGEAYNKGHTVPYEEVTDAASYVPLFHSVDSKIHSNLAVPILGGKDRLGVIDIESVYPHTYSPEQIAEVERLATQAANVLMAAQLRLAQDQLQRLNRLQLHILVQKLAHDGDIISADLQRRILRTALELMGQGQGLAALWLTHGDHLYLNAYVSSQDDVSLPTYKITQRDETFNEVIEMLPPPTPVADAVATGRPILAFHLNETPWQGEHARHHAAAQSSLTVPLLTPEFDAWSPKRVIGALCVESPDPYTFTHYHTEMLALLANETVYAIRAHDLARSNIGQIQDITHAFEQVRYPLRVEVELLAQLPMSAEATSKIQEVRRLTDLLGSLLGWVSALAPNRGRLGSIQATSVNALARDFTERVRFFAEDLEKTIAVKAPEEEVTIECSPDLIRAALFLLVQNSLRYSPQRDETEIRLSYGVDTARIEVVDHGKPIPKEERPFLFESGYRGSHGRAPAPPHVPLGTGLGLDHVRRIISVAHKGRVGYVRQRQENIFFMELPRHVTP